MQRYYHSGNLVTIHKNIPDYFINIPANAKKNPPKYPNYLINMPENVKKKIMYQIKMSICFWGGAQGIICVWTRFTSIINKLLY